MKRFVLLFIVLALLLPAAPIFAQDTRPSRWSTFPTITPTPYPSIRKGSKIPPASPGPSPISRPFADDPNTLIFNGGDTINHGTPAWSDKYMCAEWPWFNGIVDAMAFGNHDADYGPEVFAQCQAEINYPILSANTLDAGGQPLFQQDGKTYAVFEIDGVKIGVFAVAGSDYVQSAQARNQPGRRRDLSRPDAAAQEVVHGPARPGRRQRRGRYRPLPL